MKSLWSDPLLVLLFVAGLIIAFLLTASLVSAAPLCQDTTPPSHDEFAWMRTSEFWWIVVPIALGLLAVAGISHWGKKRER